MTTTATPKSTPAAKDALALLKDTLLIPEASVGHAGLKNLIVPIEAIEPVGEFYEAKVKGLSEYVERHVKEEHNVMFLKVKATSLDLVELGAGLQASQTDLLAARA